MIRPALTIAYLEKRPQSAARVLAAMNPADAAAFLETIPTRFAVRSLSVMGPWAAAPLFLRMSATHGAALLREMALPEATAILRILSADRRLSLLNEVSKDLRRDLEISLSFPGDTVGAHMITAVLALTQSHTISDALAQIRHSQSEDADTVFVIDDRRRPVGGITAGMLLQYHPDTPLGDVMDGAIGSLPARARLASVSDLAAWDEWHTLPIVNRNKELIGGLKRRSVRAAAYRPPKVTAERASLVSLLAYASLATVFDIAQMWTEIIPVPPRSKAGTVDDHER